MRTTLAIDDDVLAAARHLDEREHKSLNPVTLRRVNLLRDESA